MGLIRFIAGAGIVAAVVAYGESEAPAPSEAVRAARNAAAFCQDRRELCATAIRNGAAASSGVGQSRVKVPHDQRP